MQVEYLDPSGGLVAGRANHQGAGLVSVRNLPLYEATRAGRAFHGGQAAAGAVLPIFSNTAQVVGLWNPAGSGVNAVLTQVALTYVSTTGAAGGFVLAAVISTGASVATGAPISAFTDGTVGTTIRNGLVGALTGPKCRFTPSAATVTAPVIYRHIGLNQLVITAATTTGDQWNARVNFPGDVIIPPGNALFVAGNIATLITEAVGMSWLEEDV